MIELHPRYVVDEKGRRAAVVLEVAEYEQLVEELEKQGVLKPAEESFRQGWKEAREGKTRPVSRLSRHSKGARVPAIVSSTGSRIQPQRHSLRSIPRPNRATFHRRR